MSDHRINEAYGTTVFCEDIRLENSGQMTLVGVYQPELIVPIVPCLLPKFALLTTIVMPPVEVTDAAILNFSVFMPGDQSDHPTFNFSNPITFLQSLNDERDPDIQSHAKVLQNFSVYPLEIKSEGFIKVRCTIGGTRIRAGVLRISRTPSFRMTQAG